MSRKNKIKLRRLREVNFVDSMNSLVGSWLFLVIHVIWFITWLAWDLEINILTMIVSLEAIILMILLLMSQNRQSNRDDHRDQSDLEADLQSLELGEQILKEVQSIKRKLDK